MWEAISDVIFDCSLGQQPADVIASNKLYDQNLNFWANWAQTIVRKYYTSQEFETPTFEPYKSLQLVSKFLIFVQWAASPSTPSALWILRVSPRSPKW